MLYYYDDDCSGDHWSQEEFNSDDEAVKWAEGKVEHWKSKRKLRRHRIENAIVYYQNDDGSFRTIKEWNFEDPSYLK